MYATCADNSARSGDVQQPTDGPETFSPAILAQIEALADEYRFFHWHLEFPEVFKGENPGFDCALGNPPWDMLQLDPQEFFAVSAPQIAKASNMAAREKLIAKLVNSNPTLHEE